jgi:adenosine deaminase
VGRVLNNFGWTQTLEPSEALLVLVHHDYPDIRLQEEQLLFYRFGLGGKEKRVVLLTAGSSDEPEESYRSDWFYPLTRIQTDFPHFQAWLTRPLAGDEGLISPTVTQEFISPPSAAGCRKLLQTFLHAGWEQLSEFAKRLKTLNADDVALLNSASLPEFHYALLALCGNYENVPHDYQKRLDYCFSDLAPKETALNYRRKYFIETCEDLRRSLACRIHLPVQGRTKILLVDDNPDDFCYQLEAIFAILLRNQFELLLWVPAHEGAPAGPGSLTLDSLVSYESALRSPDLPALSLQLQHLKKDGKLSPAGKPLTLPALLPNLSFVIVDQLFKRPNGTGHFLGPNIIRGFARLMRDLSSGREERQGALPEIVALSRTFDPLRIQEALRVGARDYVLKSNLLALPAVLAKVQRSVADPPTSLQRNFRQLYNLPNETIGLLRNVRIPQVNVAKQSDQEEYEQKTRHNPARAIASILRAVPKADLHVHIGSCMEPEFLVVASLVGLVQAEHPPDGLRDLVKHFWAVIRGTPQIPNVTLRALRQESDFTIKFQSGENWITNMATVVLRQLRKTILQFSRETTIEGRKRYSSLRSLLHRDLKLYDYLPLRDALRDLPSRCTDLDLCWFWLKHSIEGGQQLDDDTLVRTYLLVLACWQSSELNYRGVNLLRWFNPEAEIQSESWQKLHRFFYEDGSEYSVTRFREKGWQLDCRQLPPLAFVSGNGSAEGENKGFRTDPIRWTLATGTRSNNLSEYLQGCEFTGSAHLRHPFLIHLYAQHVMREFVEKGVFYIELRGSPDGYTNSRLGFHFADACQCLVEAFNYAQGCVTKVFSEPASDMRRKVWLPDIFASAKPNKWHYLSLSTLADPKARIGLGPLERRYPVKVSLIFVGKRHKTTRQMIMEAAASAVLQGVYSSSVHPTAAQFMDEMKRCWVVGFDLAGKESDYPPGLFAPEFRRLGKMHIPLTVHAGENASSQFVEDAILELGTSRLGHALSLADDQRLMDRVREGRICVELCPVSNHQTCHFTESGKPGRKYPIKEYIEAGIPVCLNTDNPVISGTDIIKEFFQASTALGGEGLSLWDALLLVRMGFRHSFLPLPHRRAMLEAVDQILFDLFSDIKTNAILRELADLQTN